MIQIDGRQTIERLQAEKPHGLTINLDYTENIAPPDAERVIVLMGSGAEAAHETVEHLVAALGASGVDNALVEINGPEVPAMDGSALAFVQAIRAVGTAIVTLLVIMALVTWVYPSDIWRVAPIRLCPKRLTPQDVVCLQLPMKTRSISLIMYYRITLHRGSMLE